MTADAAIEAALQTLIDALGVVKACGETNRVAELSEAIARLKELQQLTDEPIEVVTQGYT